MDQEREAWLRAHLRLNGYLHDGDADAAIRALADIFAREKLVASEDALDYLRHSISATRAAATN